MSRKTVLPLLAAALVALSLAATACSGSDPRSNTAFPTYTPTVGPGDPTGAATSASDPSPSGELSGMTSSAAPARTPTTARPTTVRATGGAAGSTTGAPRTTIWPTRPTVSLAPSLVVTMTVAPGVDTTGVDIEGAKKAYYAVVKLADEALSRPTENWVPSYTDLAVDPALTKLTNEVSLMAEHGVHTQGHSEYVATVRVAEPEEVLLRVCVDSSGVDVVDASGRSVKSGAPTHHPQSARLARIASGKWVIAEIAVDSKKTC